MVVALYLERDVLVPIALAVLLTFVLAPLVRLLQGLYFPRIIAVAVVGLFAFAAIFGLGALMMSQVNQLAADLPRYQSTLGDTPFVASDERLPALSLSFPFLEMPSRSKDFEQHGELDVVTQSFRATIERIVAAAIRLETENDLPGSGLPPSVAAIEELPRKDAATAI